eukprot:CAMPEP_0195147658 /NCGR_PEP_ID=MMETSP0448-20130528/173828_1 /TAXON_ID=66468 /ORGANISM="Heterocapsa triquestra, Strain CCMP 448" /LENGTH=48 /DNA_ID= /DNA_START= /DNA_END= /DNA_ORIENTATION=
MARDLLRLGRPRLLLPQVGARRCVDPRGAVLDVTGSWRSAPAAVAGRL